MPIKHDENICDVPDGILREGISAVRKLSRHFKEKPGIHDLQIVNSNGLEGQQDVFHLHFHIVPRHRSDG